MAEVKTVNREEQAKECFVIMPISDADGYDQGHFNDVYDVLIKPALDKVGLKGFRSDDSIKSNHIFAEILNRLMNNKYAICDLSSKNPNVFYELGIRQAYNQKVVLIIDDKTTRPFDIADLRTINYKSSLSAKTIQEDIAKLASAIKETLLSDNNDSNSFLEIFSKRHSVSIPDNSLEVVNEEDINRFACYILPNGEILKPDDHLYLNKTLFGVYYGQTNNSLFFQLDKLFSISKKDFIKYDFTLLPF